MNFFTPDVEVGFGAFVSFYLADLGWAKGNIGIVGRLTGAAVLMPGEALADALPGNVVWRQRGS